MCRVGYAAWSQGCVQIWISLGGGTILTYDVGMAQHVEISLESVIADAESVFQRVEREHKTVTVLRFGEPVAVISPAPLTKTMGDEHREILENPSEDSQYFDVMETRRLLGL